MITLDALQRLIVGSTSVPISQLIGLLVEYHFYDIELECTLEINQTLPKTDSNNGDQMDLYFVNIWIKISKLKFEWVSFWKPILSLPLNFKVKLRQNSDPFKNQTWNFWSFIFRKYVEVLPTENQAYPKTWGQWKCRKEYHIWSKLESVIDFIP